jgi:nucleotide-binding universal stress UspA family protein
MPDGLYGVIVAGTDGSATARRAVEHAVELAATTGARLELVSAYTPVPESRLRREALDVPDDVTWMITPHEDADEVLAEAAEIAEEEGVPVRCHAREGDPASAILDVAEETGADLIVLGNKGMTGARRFLLGSVPNQVSHHAPCSVLIVRTT